MFDQTVQRVGFACKVQELHDKPLSGCNQKSTTIKWLSSQTRAVAEKRLWDLAQSNVQALQKQLEYVAKLPHAQRMFRISSDLLPAYTHDDWLAFYFTQDMTNWLERNLARCGEYARKHDIRLSFHPGQFCVLASENPEIVERSIVEFEYHCDIIRYMGFGREFQDFKCNVHIGGKRGPEGIKQAMRKLSPEARNTLTIENAEFTWGLDASLELVNTCALVLDIHHHLIHSGEYIGTEDSRFKQVLESWRNVRPVIHYSVSREEHLPNHCIETLPNIKLAVANGITKAKLRAHSDYYWNNACNRWAGSFMPYADIMLESKQKNLARDKFCASISI
jgi:UV DNA damage repair endonuclease